MKKYQEKKLNKQIEQHKKQSLSKLICYPSDFLGIFIQHCAREEGSFKVSCKRAQVVQIDHINRKTTSCHVKYEDWFLKRRSYYYILKL